MSITKQESRVLSECHDCGVKPGQYHQLGCDVELCPRCGGQLLMCLIGCCFEFDKNEPDPPPQDDREIWTGEWPGSQECREFGWFSREVLDNGWQRCEADTPGALPDLNRLQTEADWDRRDKRF